MNEGQIHYEVFVRRTPSGGWSLACAGENRSRMIDEARTILSDGRAVAVRVVKEELDPDSREFSSVVILTEGDAPPPKPASARVEAARGPACVSAPDLYTLPARATIARLLEGWLRRKGVTAFELLHRPDLALELDGSGVELQGAMQKLAVAEAGGSGGSLHDYIRRVQALTEAAIARLVRDGRRNAFPCLDVIAFDQVAARLVDHADGAYLLGGGVAAYMADARRWRLKVERLVDLAEAAPADGPARAFALGVLEQPLIEILGSHAALSELACAESDNAQPDALKSAPRSEEPELGRGLAMLTRLAAAPEAAALTRLDPSLAEALPPLMGPMARLAALMVRDQAFEATRGAVAQRVLRELNGPRRLRPGDAEAEIALLRALALALTAAAGRCLPLEDVQTAFIERSKRLVAADFITAYLAERSGPMAEAFALVRLTENLVGQVNRLAAARWLNATLASLRFETAARAGGEPVGVRLAALADLQRGLAAAKLPAALCARVGEVGGFVEADAGLLAQLARAGAPPVTRLLLLMRMAAGQSAPLGPAADRARVEAMKLIREPQVRAELASRPEALERVRTFVETVAA